MESSANKGENNIHHLSTIVDKYSKKMPTEISLALKDILEKKLQDIDFGDDMISKDSFETIIHDYMKKIAPTLKQVSKQIANILLSKMKSEYKLLNNNK